MFNYKQRKFDKFLYIFPMTRKYIFKTAFDTFFDCPVIQFDFVNLAEIWGLNLLILTAI